jgi:hypothetical protein
MDCKNIAERYICVINQTSVLCINLKPKKIMRYIISLSLLSLLISCKKTETTPTTRPFYLSFTPFPYEISSQAVDYAYDQISKNADMITHSFDEGVPWVEALANQPFAKNIQDDWNYRLAKTPKGHKVFVQQSAISFLREGLALYRKETNEMPLPKPWDTLSFNNSQVKTAYLNYCKRQIDFFKPDYYGFSIEPNIMLAKKPEKWAAYVDFHTYIYAELKKAYPSLPLLFSFAGTFILRGYEDNVNYDAQEKAVRDMLPYTDIVGVSLYIYGSKISTTNIPTDVFDKLKTLGGSKPMGITETGYISKDLKLDIPTANGIFTATIPSDEQKQANYISLLLKNAEKHNFRFVNNFVLRDYDKLWQQVGGKNDISALWRNTGLFTAEGKEKLALATWQTYLKRTIK